MQNLEARLNCRLFDRLGRSILPTPAAQVLYPKAVTILEDLRRLESEVASTAEVISGELILGASTIPGTYILPMAAAAFKRDYPGISFEIRINDSARIAEAIADNALFIGFVGAKLPGAKLIYQPFAEDDLILAAAGTSDYPNQVTISDLCKMPFIVRERGSGTRKSMELLLAKQHLAIDQLTICATLGSSAAVKEAIKANLGVSVISRLAVRDEIALGSVREIAIDGFTMQRNFYIVTAAKRTLPNHYQEFVKRLLAP
jgi:DNA-binding transcriptional LysR family regulator